MRLTRLRLLLPVLAFAALAMVLASCGSSDESTSGGGGAGEGIPAEFAAPTAAPDSAKDGGTLTVLSAGDIDYMDPGAAYYQFTYMMDLAVFRPLLSWPPDATTPQPDLAESQPEVSSDNQTITFHLRSGVKYSPPVDREVKSEDVKYAVERTLLAGIPNGYTAAYLGDLVGFAEAQKAAAKNDTVAPDIKGITTPDDSTIVFELTKPTSAAVIQALSLPVSAPVPEEYAKQYDAETPSTYGQYVTFTGPYMVENDCVKVNSDGSTEAQDCSSGKLTGYTPGKSIELVRNPNWDESTDYRPAYVDHVTFQEGFSDPTSMSQKILSGSAQVNGDTPPSKTIVQQIAQGTKYETTQLSASASGGNRYVALNTTLPPFDDINVRKAVIAGSDREALRNTRGGELFGPVATHFIPPGIPGFEEAGGLAGDPSLDFIQNPNGDPAVAAKYMKKAGYKSGKCEGPECEITMVADDAPPGSDTSVVLKNQLEDLGFDVNLRPVAHDIMYTRFCSVPKSEPNICPNVGWIKDFNDPQSILQVPFDGTTINPSNNSNWPQLDVPAINKAIAQATLVNEPQARAEAWGKLDSQIMAQAPAIPWVWDNDIYINSKDVAFVANLFNAEPDLAFTSLK